jgi:glycosyltransferase involved in cell wall biosynthesis
MHILYLHQYFKTPQEVGGTRSYEFAKRLVEAGYSVTMITAQDHSQPWTGKGLLSRRVIDGIDIVEVRAGYRNGSYGTTLPYHKRILAFLQFAVLSCWAVLNVSKPDVVFATSTPLTIGIPGIVASRRWRIPLVFEVRDLWPEAPIQMGALRHPVLIAITRRLEQIIYRSYSHIIALSPGMAAGIRDAGIAAEKISTIPNASDLTLFRPDVDGSEFRKRYELHERFVCSYFGTMGEANDLTYVLQAAQILQAQGDSRIAFVLHGSGKRRDQLKAFCAQHQLTNVVFSDPVPDKSAVARLAAASDVCMTIYKNVPVLYTCSPNKFFDSLAAGRPVLVNTPGWLRDLVEEHRIGVWVEPDSAESIVKQVTYLCDHRDVGDEYGRNSRRLAETMFSRDQLAKELEQVLLGVVARD